MAEGRMLKRRISESKKLGALASDSARLLYTWLIPWLDIEGRHSGDAEIIKGHIFPKVISMTVEKIDGLLKDLAVGELIVLYEADGERWLQFKKFKEIQTLHPEREAKSEIPAPPQDNSCVSMSPHDNSTQVKLSEVKLSEVKKTRGKSKLMSTHEPNAIDVRLVQMLIDLMLKNNPESSIIKRLTEKRQREWINQCRLLREADKKTIDQIEAVIQFSQRDSFWKGNILSMPTFREKWDQLWMKMRRDTGADRSDGIKEWYDAEKRKERAGGPSETSKS